MVVLAAGWTVLGSVVSHFPADVPTDDSFCFYADVETGFAHSAVNGYPDGYLWLGSSGLISKVVF